MANILSLHFDNLHYKSSSERTTTVRDDAGKVLHTDTSKSCDDTTLDGKIDVDAGDLLAILLKLKEKAKK